MDRRDDAIRLGRHNEAARLWISGLEAVNRKLGLSRANRRQSDVWLTRECRFPLGDLQPVKFPSLSSCFISALESL
jgi:hypothetical protein